MFNLEKPEKIVIACLVSLLLIGLGVMWYKKSHPAISVRVESFNIDSKNIDMADLKAKAKININEADIEDLMRLKGVGKVLSGRIIDYRFSNGPFHSIDEIRSVKGVGDALFEKIKDSIRVE